MIILGIETSCDETAASVCNNGNIESSIVLSQEIHTNLGGVVPELASREHDSQINYIVQRALTEANLTLQDIEGIAVTYGPGLLGSLIVGVNYAKGLSIGLNIPFLGINHLEGHLYANFISSPKIEFPFICLLVTGGHTQIWEIQNHNQYILHSNSIDDAAGEAFDKGARILGLKYPGGPEIEKIAKIGNSDKYKFPIPRVKDNPLDFSFSGLKTAILYKVQNISKDEYNLYKADIAASYQEAIIDTLLDRLKRVVSNTGINTISITGGVAANMRLKYKVNSIANKLNLTTLFPSLKYCTDNAAMIAIAGYQKLNEGFHSNLDLQPNPNLALNE